MKKFWKAIFFLLIFFILFSLTEKTFAQGTDPVETRYMRSDDILGTSHAPSAAPRVVVDSIIGDVPVDWALRVWAGGTEIQEGRYKALVSRTDVGRGMQSATWDCPLTSLNPVDNVTVRVYMRFGIGGPWREIAAFNSEALGASQLDAATWTVWYYTQRSFLAGTTVGAFAFGSSTVNSRIENFSYTTPTPVCSPLNYPSDRWQRVYYVYSTGACLGDGPDEISLTFDNDWGGGIVAHGRSDDIQFSSSRTIDLPAGNYTFTVGSDDGIRLWIDGILRIDRWIDRSYATDSIALSLAAGSHTFRIDWYENGGDARVSFNFCARNPPTITALNTPQSATAGTNLTYNFNGTNNDSPGCGNSNLVFSITNCPAGWSCSSALASIVAPGTTVSRSLNITSADGATPGDYNLTAQILNAISGQSNTTQIRYTVIAPATWPHVSITAPANVNVNQEFSVSLTYTHDAAELGGIHLRWLDEKFDILDKAGCTEYYDNPDFAPGWEGIECSHLSSGTTKTFKLKALISGDQTLYYRAWDDSRDYNCGTYLDHNRDPPSGTCGPNCHPDQFPDRWEDCDAYSRSITVTTACSVSFDKDSYTLGETMTVNYSNAPDGTTMAIRDPSGATKVSWTVSGSGSKSYTLLVTDLTGTWETVLVKIGQCGPVTDTAMVTAVPCIRANPEIEISPHDRFGKAGETLIFNITATNADSVGCKLTNLILSYSCPTIPSNWSCGFGKAGFLIVAPGASVTTTLSVTSPADTPPGNYSISVTVTNVKSLLTGTDMATVTIGYECPPKECQDLLDLVKKLYGKDCSYSNYDPRADIAGIYDIKIKDLIDLNGDGKVDEKDKEMYKDGKIDINDISAVSSRCTGNQGPWCQAQLNNTYNPCCHNLIMLIKSLLGKKCCQLGYTPVADVNKDGEINIIDVSFVARLIGTPEKCQELWADTSKKGCCTLLLTLISAANGKKYGEAGFNHVADINDDCVVDIKDSSAVGRMYKNPGECERLLHVTTDPCAAPFCGNGKKEGNEECDGTDFGGATCVSLGHLGGKLTCKANCTFDTSECISSIVKNPCPPQLKGGLVPCGRTCDDLDTPERENCPCTLCHFFILGDRIVDFALFKVVFPLAALMIVIGGAMFLTAGGNPGVITTAKTILTYTAIGTGTILAAWIIVNTVFMFIGVAEWTGLKEGWWKITCEVADKNNDSNADCIFDKKRACSDPDGASTTIASVCSNPDGTEVIDECLDETHICEYICPTNPQCFYNGKNYCFCSCTPSLCPSDRPFCENGACVSKPPPPPSKLCEAYTNDIDCTLAGCNWWPECSDHKQNAWGKDKCVERGTDPGYKCVLGECGAECDTTGVWPFSGQCWMWAPYCNLDTCKCYFPLPIIKLP